MYTACKENHELDAVIEIATQGIMDEEDLIRSNSIYLMKMIIERDYRINKALDAVKMVINKGYGNKEIFDLIKIILEKDALR